MTSPLAFTAVLRRPWMLANSACEHSCAISRFAFSRTSARPDQLNNYFGRRGAIFITATLSWLTCFWSAVTNSWPHMFAARFVLGLGIGPKSSTVPVYSAECAPANIRGALVMMWQMWTAL